MSDKTTTFNEVLKGATTVSNIAGKSMLLTDANGNPSKVSLSGVISDLNAGSANELKGQNSTQSPSPTLPSDFSQSYRAETVRYSSDGFPVSFIVSGAWQRWEIAIKESTSRTNAALLFRVSGTSDWYSWRTIAFVDSNVASANQLSAQHLSNEDLNTLSTPGTSFWATSGNTCANNPFGSGTAFGLSVYPASGSNRVQIAYAYNSVTSYKRLFTGSVWSAWKKMLTEDDISSLTAKISALEAKLS